MKEAAEGNGEPRALPAGAGGRRGGRRVLSEAMGLVEGGGWKRGSLGLTSAGVSLRNPLKKKMHIFLHQNSTELL